MTDGTKFDPFKPAQPLIPGVPAAEPEKRELPSEEHRTKFEPATPKGKIPKGVWLLAAFAIASVIGAVFYLHSVSTDKPPATTLAEAPDTASVETSSRSERLPIAPGIIATTRELKNPWSSKRFLFRGDLSPDPVPSMVVRLPNGQYWGLSMVEPFGTCKLEYVTDPRELQAKYNFRADHPMVADPCTRTVYDLLQYDGGAPNGGLVRGAIVHGTGVRPPMAIEIEVDGAHLRAVRME